MPGLDFEDSFLDNQIWYPKNTNMYDILQN